MNHEATGLRARLIDELKKTLVVFVYLLLFLGAVSTYRRLLLAEYQVNYLHYGYTFAEALVLAKVIVFGSVLRIGERFHDRPLIIPTLYKALCFSILVLAFSILEHLLLGWLRGKATTVVVEEVLAQSIWEILSHALVVLLALLPLFAIWETSRVLGEGKLYELFFLRSQGARLDRSDSASQPLMTGGDSAKP
jgi:hypothetical protein